MMNKNILEKRDHYFIVKGELYNYYFVDAKIEKEEKELIKLIREIITKGFPKNRDLLFVKEDFYVNLIDAIESVFGKTFPPKEVTEDQIEDLAKRLNKGDDENFKKALKYALYELGKISYLINNPDLEEIMINGIGKPIFVFHTNYGMCETNLKIKDSEEMEALVKKMISRSEIYTYGNIIDGKLYDGSRINITKTPIVEDTVITIRKFLKNKHNILDLIRNNTLTSEVAAFLWLCVDGFGLIPQNMIISGGTFSGKTTLLNALSVFIPSHERIVSIEDTYELNLIDKPNWVRMKTTSTEDMATLIKNSLRMRPDRLLVGEVRGKEALDMFVAMDVGARGVMCTLHANNPGETIVRLKNEPMNVPDAMFVLLNLVLTIQKINVPGKGVKRRIISIADIKRTEDNVLLNHIYSYDYKKDRLVKTEVPTRVIEDIAMLKGISKIEVMNEIERRKKFLEALLNRNISFEDLPKYITKYYIKTKILEN